MAKCSFAAVTAPTAISPGPEGQRPVVRESGVKRLSAGSTPKPNCGPPLPIALPFAPTSLTVAKRKPPEAASTPGTVRMRATSEAGTLGVFAAPLTICFPETTTDVCSYGFEKTPSKAWLSVSVKMKVALTIPMPSTIASAVRMARVLRPSSPLSATAIIVRSPPAWPRALPPPSSADFLDDLPSARKRIRSASAAARASWVTITVVWPSSSTEWRRRASTSLLVFESRLPVGSSANSTDGLEIRARAIETRCCWPPESSRGAVLAAVVDPDRLEQLLEPLVLGLLAGDRERQDDVLLRGQHRQQVEELEDEADVIAAKPSAACRSCR